MNPIHRHFNPGHFTLSLLIVTLPQSILPSPTTPVEVPEIGENFKSAIQNYDLAIVKFQAEWCGACKNLKRQINDGNAVKNKLASFVVTHVSGDAAKAWKEDGYVGSKIRDGDAPNSHFCSLLC